MKQGQTGDIESLEVQLLGDEEAPQSKEELQDFWLIYHKSGQVIIVEQPTKHCLLAQVKCFITASSPYTF
jgi:hypothetical protein